MITERNPQTIVKLLKKKSRASAADLGTDAATMKLLQAADVVTTDGTIKGKGRGRPPVAWVLAKDADLDNLPVIDEPVTRNGDDGISQAQIDKAIEEVVNGLHGPDCKCGLHTGMTLADIRALNAGCTADPWPGQDISGMSYFEAINRYGEPRKTWVCPALDALRRRLGAR